MSEPLSRIEHKVDRIADRQSRAEHVLLDLVRFLLSTKDHDMSKLHDDLLAAARSLDSAADKTIAAKTEDESQLADVLTLMQSTEAKLNAAAADDAAQGGSTGGGSGSGGMVAETSGQQGTL